MTAPELRLRRFDMARSVSGGTAIRTPDQLLRVFVSSTLGELAPEIFDAAQARGRELTTKEAVALALSTEQSAKVTELKPGRPAFPEVAVAS